MNSKRLLKLISEARQEANKYLDNRIPSKFFKDTDYVLDLIRKEIASNTGSPLNMNPRVFSAYRDICTVTVKSFEDTDLEKSILALRDALEEEIPEFNNLGPLRMDFGKQDPI